MKQVSCQTITTCNECVADRNSDSLDGTKCLPIKAASAFDPIESSTQNISDVSNITFDESNSISCASWKDV
jgi:hypothetical protein